jgi:hypothetical protein
MRAYGRAFSELPAVPRRIRVTGALVTTLRTSFLLVCSPLVSVTR